MKHRKSSKQFIAVVMNISRINDLSFSFFIDNFIFVDIGIDYVFKFCYHRKYILFMLLFSSMKN